MLEERKYIYMPLSTVNRPLLKWAGGKTQLLTKLLPKVPYQYNRYIEPFFGGGALFFALSPLNSIIVDKNQELINLYRTVATDIELAVEVKRLHALGCHIILTNSNHPLVIEQYQEYSIEVVQTKRSISCKGATRNSEDVIVHIPA